MCRVDKPYVKILLLAFLFLTACNSELNDPYPASERGQNILTEDRAGMRRFSVRVSQAHQ